MFYFGVLLWDFGPVGWSCGYRAKNISTLFFSVFHCKTRKKLREQPACVLVGSNRRQTHTNGVYSPKSLSYSIQTIHINTRTQSHTEQIDWKISSHKNLLVFFRFWMQLTAFSVMSQSQTFTANLSTNPTSTNKLQVIFFVEQSLPFSDTFLPNISFGRKNYVKNKTHTVLFFVFFFGKRSNASV